jgi:hypothetical protein
MNLKNKPLWDDCVAKNSDPYGKCAIDVARRVMELMDEPGPVDAHGLIDKANDELDAGITGFMAGCVAKMASQCHARGDEFQASWNRHYGIEPEEGNSDTPPRSGTVNPAILTIGSSK